MSIVWIAIGGLVVCVGGSIAFPFYWKGTIRDSNAPHSLGFWGVALWRAQRRVILGIFIAVWGLELAILASFFTADPEGPRWLDGRFDALAWVLFAFFAGMFVMGWLLVGTITLFNRPKFLVPPFLRDEPGALRYWISERRRKDRRSLLITDIFVGMALVDAAALVVFLFVGG